MPSTSVPEQLDGTWTGDPATIGGAPPEHDRPAVTDLVQPAHRAEPNGWCAGPADDPDRYQLLGPGRSGGEGDIWCARRRDAPTSRVAVKRLRRPARAGADWPAPADLHGWEQLRDLLLVMRIEHLVDVIEVFAGPPPHPPGPAPRRAAPLTPYLVMEWVPGPTLAEEHSARPATTLTLAGRLQQIVQVATTLAALHAHSTPAGHPILHRDVKPANCILAPQRGVVLVDVGTMWQGDDGRDASGRHTPAYTAPEVLADPTAPRQPASDRYSLGALAWFCVTGKNPPPAGERVRAEVLAAARSAGLPDPRAFADQLTRMLARRPADRPADALAWAEHLLRLGTPPQP